MYLQFIVNEYLENKSKLKTSYKIEKLFFREMLEYLEEKKVTNIQDVTPKLLDFYQSFLRSKKKASSVNRQFSLYNHFFTKCIEWGYIKESPTRFLKKLKEQEPERKLYTRVEVIQILKNSEGWFRNYFYVLYKTGIRPHELSALTAQDCDFDRMSMNLYCKKNKGEMRTLPINRTVCILLKRLANEGDGLLFKNDLGNKITTDHANKKLAKLQRK